MHACYSYSGRVWQVLSAYAFPPLISGFKVVRWAEPERGQSVQGLEAIYERLQVYIIQVVIVIDSCSLVAARAAVVRRGCG